MAVKDVILQNTSLIEEAITLVSEMDDREGQYVWEKLTTENGDFVANVTSDLEDSYPNGGMQDGYWYKQVIKGDGTWTERTTATSAGKTIYSSHSNPNAVYGGGCLPKTQDPGYARYYHACCGIYGTTVAHMVGTTTNNSGNAMPYVYTTNLTISGNKITIPSVAYGNDPAFTLNLVVCRV